MKLYSNGARRIGSCAMTRFEATELRIDLFTPMFMQGRSDIFVPGTSAVAWVDKTHINMTLRPKSTSGSKRKRQHVVIINLHLAFSLQIPSCLEFL